MKPCLVMFVALGLLVGSVSAAHAEQSTDLTHRTVEASYYGSQLLGDCAPFVEVGCATIETFADESSLTAKVTDAHGQPIMVRVFDESKGTLYGTFCGETTEPVYFTPGAKLELWVGDGWWPRWWVIPLGCYGYPTTGTVSVTLTGWPASQKPPSPEPAESPAQQPSPTGETAATERAVDLVLRHHVRAAGSVVAADASCSSAVPVVIQKRKFDDWLDVASTTTDGDGGFAVRLPDRSGRYRAIASEARISEATCLAAKSAAVRHQH